MNPPDNAHRLDRRTLLAAGSGALSASMLGFAQSTAKAEESSAQDSGSPVPMPKTDRNILLSCKLGMIADKRDGKTLSLVERLKMADAAGFDGVDFDQAGKYTVAEARDAVAEAGVFVHNAINHAHWNERLTSPDPAVRATSRANVEHCIRVSHATGGSGVLIVVGRSSDGTKQEVLQRCSAEIRKMIPLAASLGQPILIENVWNGMMYEHDGPDDQSAQEFVNFVDSFHSRWVGMYYDIGNHWKYGQPGEWIRAFGHRCVKLDVKGYSRAKSNWTEIGEGDLPWHDVRKALEEIHFTGWATAEVGGGDVDRLTVVRKQMEEVFALS